MDIDECKENPRICNGGKCTNIAGGYICTCTDGLIPGKDSASCIGKCSLEISQLSKSPTFNYPDVITVQMSTSVPRGQTFVAMVNVTIPLVLTIVDAKKDIR